MSRIEMTGPGRGRQESHPPRTCLFNFDIGGAHLKTAHHDYLRMYVVPVLKRGGSVSIVGYASRTGSTAFNHHLSQQRADRTLTYLRGEVRNDFAALMVVGHGELKARDEGQRDNTENPVSRSVMVYSWETARPLPVPTRIDLSTVFSRDLLPGVDVGDSAQKYIDIISMFLQALEEIPVDKISSPAGIAGGLFNIVGAVAQMPLLWMSVRHQSRENGRAEGFWDAIQDMANAYADPALDSTSISRWPPLREPRAHGFGVPEEHLLLSQRQWLEGRRKGCREAFDAMTKKELKAPNGGRRYLRAASKDWGSGVAAEIRRLYNVMLGAEWPTRK